MPREEPTAIRVEGLVKQYGSRIAVNDVSFTINAGEVFALLGPNGAGKTTTVEILEGYRRPDAGVVQALGHTPWTGGGAYRMRIGAMVQGAGLYPTITPREALDLFSRYYTRARGTDSLLDLVGLIDSASTRYRRLSGGQKQRLALALALVGYPDLVFLDEPTSGMDPQARRATWDIIQDLKRSGVTVLLTTHYLEEAERLADRVAIMDAGRIVVQGGPTDLMGERVPVIRFATDGPINLSDVYRLATVKEAREDRSCNYVVTTDDPASALADITEWARDTGAQITEIHIGRRSLEDVFLEVTGREFRA